MDWSVCNPLKSPFLSDVCNAHMHENRKGCWSTHRSKGEREGVGVGNRQYHAWNHVWGSLQYILPANTTSYPPTSLSLSLTHTHSPSTQTLSGEALSWRNCKNLPKNESTHTHPCCTDLAQYQEVWHEWMNVCLCRERERERERERALWGRI